MAKGESHQVDLGSSNKIERVQKSRDASLQQVSSSNGANNGLLGNIQAGGGIQNQNKLLRKNFLSQDPKKHESGGQIM